MKKNRLVVKLLAALTAFGAVFAMAATLGVSSNDLGAGTQTVAACDSTGVTADYPTPTFNDSTDVYEISSVTVKNIHDECVGQTVAVALQDGTTVLSTGTSSSGVTDGDLLASDNNSITVSLGAPVSAERVTKVHVTIAE